jgi:hypothetical protein
VAIPEIVGAGEAAEILGIGNTNFSHLRKNLAGTPSSFPEPVVQLKCGPIWLKKDVEKYASSYSPRRRSAQAVTEEAPVKKSVARKAVAKKAPAKKIAVTRKVLLKKTLASV